MASTPLQPSHMELWEQPQIEKPEPLRIVKERANTVTGCDTTKRVPVPRRGSAEQPDTCGSSPEGPNTPLRVFKRRKNRGSALEGTLEWTSRENPSCSDASQSTELRDLPQGNEDTFKGIYQSSARVASMGSFLKSELFRGSSESELNLSLLPHVKLISPVQEDMSTPLNTDLFPPFKLGDLGPNQEFSSTSGQRRKSVGKRLVSKALNGLGNARSKSIHLLGSTSSNDSLLRRLSLKKIDSSRKEASEASSRNSSRFSFDQESVLIRDSRSIPLTCVDEFPPLPKLPLILYPEIAVIPEVGTVDLGDEVSLWVAVTVTGVLRKTADYDLMSDTFLASKNSSCTSQDQVTSENDDYGYLYGVDITLAARKGCVLECVISEQDQPRCLHLGQTELTLAKVKLLVGRRNLSHIRESSKELIAELEGRLGDATTEYLNIGISYKHSAFSTSRRTTDATNGLSYHTTTMRIEAHAAIKRHCSRSSWSCQTSESQDSNELPNPVVSLITAHCSPVKAARLIRKITSNSFSLAQVHRQNLGIGRRWNSSSETITPIRKRSFVDMLHEAARVENSGFVSVSKQSLDITQAGFHDTNSNLSTLTLNPCSDPDPARKIWSEMRKTSRGTGKRMMQMSGSLGMDTEDTGSANSEVEASVQKEQARIMEIALRNKRSLGAETLRSMAGPSISMNFGIGRGWGWGPPWW